MKEKKILIVNTVEFIMGGISSVITNYYKEMKNYDIQIDFIVNKKIEPCYLDIIDENKSNIYILDRNRNPMKYMLQLYFIIKKNSYDVIHVHGNSATMIVDLFPAVLGKVKVRIAHSHNTKCSHPFIHAILSPVFKLTYTKALACSKGAGEWIFGKDNFEVLENGIDLDRYMFFEDVRQEVRAQMNLADKFVLGHVGLINEQKNHQMLLKIIYEMKKNFSNVFLLCVTGSERIPDEIKCLIEEYRLEDDILFLFKRNDVYRLLQAMDVLVFPSKWEGFPVALVEAQASGLPCIVSDCITSEIKLTGNIQFKSNYDVAGWCEEIEKLYKTGNINRVVNSRKSKKEIKEAGFDLKENVSKLYSWYNK